MNGRTGTVSGPRYNNVVQVTELEAKMALGLCFNYGDFSMNRANFANPGGIRKATRRAGFAGRCAHRQRGMTTLGIIILVSFLGLFAFAAMRLTPIYLNYLKVAGVVNGVYDEYDSQNPTRTQLLISIRRRFGVESVDEIKFRDVKITAVDGGYEIVAKYDHTSPFIYNVYFTVKFDKRVVVRR